MRKPAWVILKQVGKMVFYGKKVNGESGTKMSPVRLVLFAGLNALSIPCHIEGLSNLIPVAKKYSEIGGKFKEYDEISPDLENEVASILESQWEVFKSKASEWEKSEYGEKAKKFTWADFIKGNSDNVVTAQLMLIEMLPEEKKKKANELFKELEKKAFLKRELDSFYNCGGCKPFNKKLAKGAFYTVGGVLLNLVGIISLFEMSYGEDDNGEGIRVKTVIGGKGDDL